LDYFLKQKWEINIPNYNQGVHDKIDDMTFLMDYSMPVQSINN